MTFSISAKIQDGSQNLVPKINAFYAEIQDGRQKWQESDFCEKSTVDSADNLQVRNFVEITLFRTVSQIKVFCVLHRNSRCPLEVAGKQFLRKIASRLCIYPSGQNCSISHRFPEINALYAEIQDGCQKWRESDFLRKVAGRLYRYPAGPKFPRHHSISHRLQDKCAFAFYTEIQDGL